MNYGVGRGEAQREAKLNIKGINVCFRGLSRRLFEPESFLGIFQILPAAF